MNDLTKKLKCLVMRNGVEIWREEDRLANLTGMLTSNQKIGFIEVDGETINSVDIVGIFSPETMEEMTRRKNGQWKCKKGVWHSRGEKCECHMTEIEKEQERRLMADLAGDDISEEERIKNLDNFRGMKKNIFKN